MNEIEKYRIQELTTKNNDLKRENEALYFELDLSRHYKNQIHEELLALRSLQLHWKKITERLKQMDEELTKIEKMEKKDV